MIRIKYIGFIVAVYFLIADIGQAEEGIPSRSVLVYREMVETISKMNLLLEKVNDKESADAQAPKIQKLMDRLTELQEESATLRKNNSTVEEMTVSSELINVTEEFNELVKLTDRDSGRSKALYRAIYKLLPVALSPQEYNEYIDKLEKEEALAATKLGDFDKNIDFLRKRTSLIEKANILLEIVVDNETATIVVPSLQKVMDSLKDLQGESKELSKATIQGRDKFQFVQKIILESKSAWNAYVAENERILRIPGFSNKEFSKAINTILPAVIPPHDYEEYFDGKENFD